ncbi:tyrosine--tRNA ligase [Candidatus Pacearchaeota archaeon]|nr:tyrosine--tRNA ligase [Candidatus Pacearchaeota archaeon]MBI2056666.1 tyrosine--tRNA ligase [Candidatus Pacearchaeota archaeon]
MELNKKLELVRRNTEEIITEEDLMELLKKKKNPVVYCGYEPNGPMHLGHFVTITKLMDLEKAGFKIKILLADIHAMLNRKGDEEAIKKEVELWKKTIKAIGINAEIILGSSFQFSKEYQFEIMKLAQHSTINRGLRSMQEIARDIENATISQLWYPLMQVADIKYLKADVALGGIEQRKVHMIGKDLKKILDYDFIALHTPLITSLKGPGEKMSKSISGSGISVTDSYEEIKSTIKGAYCPEKEIKENPVLQIAKLIIFPKFNAVEIKRDKKFGGDLKIKNYEELEKIYSDGKLHPMDLKNAAGEYLEKIISPIRKNFK